MPNRWNARSHRPLRSHGSSSSFEWKTTWSVPGRHMHYKNNILAENLRNTDGLLPKALELCWKSVTQHHCFWKRKDMILAHLYKFAWLRCPSDTRICRNGCSESPQKCCNRHQAGCSSACTILNTRMVADPHCEHKLVATWATRACHLAASTVHSGLTHGAMETILQRSAGRSTKFLPRRKSLCEYVQKNLTPCFSNKRHRK